jgi:hypothetical protein
VEGFQRGRTLGQTFCSRQVNRDQEPLQADRWQLVLHTRRAPCQSRLRRGRKRRLSHLQLNEQVAELLERRASLPAVAGLPSPAEKPSRTAKRVGKFHKSLSIHAHSGRQGCRPLHQAEMPDATALRLRHRRGRRLHQLQLNGEVAELFRFNRARRIGHQACAFRGCVAQIGNLPFRRLAACIAPPSLCTPPTTNQRYSRQTACATSPSARTRRHWQHHPYLDVQVAEFFGIDAAGTAISGGCRQQRQEGSRREQPDRPTLREGEF